MKWYYAFYHEEFKDGKFKGGEDLHIIQAFHSVHARKEAIKSYPLQHQDKYTKINMWEITRKEVAKIYGRKFRVVKSIVKGGGYLVTDYRTGYQKVLYWAK